MKHIAGLFIIFSIIGCGAPPQPPSDNLTRLQEVSSIRMPTVTGQQRSIRDFRGNIVMLHFFSSWCPECNMEAPTLRNLQMNFSGQRFAILGVAIDDDPYEIQSFTSKYQLPYPVILDTEKQLSQFFGIKELPVTLFLDRRGVPINFKDPLSGQACAKIIGGRQWDTATPVQMVAALVENG